jgi:perosamine synthetase
MIRLTKPELTGAIEGLKSVLESGYLVQGKLVGEFERMVAGYLGRAFAVSLNSGTSAIQCALMSLGLGEGDQVVIPDFTFPATANAVIRVGATPLLVDIDPSTFNVDVSAVESALTPQAKAVMPVDLFGLAADLAAMGEICEHHGLLLIEDSACALGASRDGGKCGSFGDASVISFHPRKIVTTGEGGMVLTDREEVAGMVRKLRNHGIQTSSGRTQFVLAGYNLRMNEMEACLGMVQMKVIGDLIDRRRRVAGLYGQLLAGIDEVKVPEEPRGCFHTYQSYVVMLDEKVDRDRLISCMLEQQVETTLGTYAIHAQPYYRDRLGLQPGSLPQSYRAFRQSLSLPIYASMGQAEVGQVAASLRESIPKASAGK